LPYHNILDIDDHLAVFLLDLPISDQLSTDSGVFHDLRILHGIVLAMRGLGSI